MGNDVRRDVVRQVVGVAGAVFQALAGVFFVVSLSSAPVVDEKGATLIDPAGYAFIIWAPIFLLSLAYAVYQALPSRQRDTLLRRVGWPLAGAFFLSGLWEIAAPLGRLGVAQVLIAGMLVCLAVAYLRLVRSGRASLSLADRWLVALPIGVYFGWITAANAVSLTALAARSGLVSGEGFAGALLGAALLLVGSAVAALLVRIGKAGVPQGYLAYGVTVLWALFSVVANQYQASVFTTVVAAVCVVLVVLALFAGGRSRPFGAPAAQH